MTGLASTIANLSRAKTGWADALNSVAGAASVSGAARGAGPARLERIAAFGSNPGRLEMLVHVPAQLAPRPALVVVLHGCGQDAAGYDRGSGWSDLADRHGFVLLYPQQTNANNPKGCFNWFQPEDIGRDQGEALSIRQMVEHVVVQHGIDRTRVHVTGLSAGGAMAAVMLAAYPEMFAGGAVIAGLPYGTASNVQDALNSMFKGVTLPAKTWGDKVRSASRHPGPWPKLSVWHGGTDTIVRPGNAAELIKQWTDLHGLPAAPTGRSVVDGHPRETWRNGAGEEVIESFAIAGMGHGTPLHVGTGDDQGGAAGPFLLDVGISSSHHIASFWRIADWQAPAASVRPEGQDALVGEILPPIEQTRAEPARPEDAFGILDGLGRGGVRPEVLATIQQAFRAAGLVKS